MNRTILATAVAIAALVACTEAPQTVQGGGPVHDSAAWQGPATAFTAAGWKPGEKTSWEQGLKTRTVNGQNEYTRVN